MFQEAYDEWRLAPATGSPVAVPKPYRPTWGGGCRATPFTYEELHEHLEAYGWPSDDIFRNRFKATAGGLPRPTLGFEASVGYDPWGITIAHCASVRGAHASML